MDGLLCVSHPRYTVGLVVENGIVIEAPPYARRWTLGRTVLEVTEAAGPQAKYAWMEDGRNDVQCSDQYPHGPHEWGDENMVRQQCQGVPAPPPPPNPPAK